MMREIRIHEVGLRDGLQMESTVVPTEQKEAWIRRLMRSGVDLIQVGSFVHPEKVPQMADTDDLFRRLVNEDESSVVLSGLVLNERGLDRAMECEVDLICMGVSASDTHSRKNTGMDTEEATQRMIAAARSAMNAGKRVQMSVQSAFGCGFEGSVAEERVVSIVQRYLDAGVRSVGLADTAGHAYPGMVQRRFEAVQRLDSSVDFTCHFHNTYGLGMANVYAALSVGVKTYDSSIAGLGGCPFTKVAAGNVPTEDLIHALNLDGLRTDVNLGDLIELAREVAGYFDREMEGFVYKTGPIAHD